MIKQHACAKHLAAMEGVTVCYNETTLKARNKQARKRSIHRRGGIAYDKQAKYGPPDRQCHFNNKKDEKLNARENTPKFHTFLQIVTQRCSVWNLNPKKLELTDDCK